MKILRKSLKSHRDKIDDNGFTIIEMVVAIPMLALVGGIVILTMGKTLSIVDQNSTAIKAAGEIRNTMNEAREATSCYDLKSFTGIKKVSTDDTSPFTITTELVGNCVTGKNNVFKSTAIQDKNSRKLFESTTKIFIVGN